LEETLEAWLRAHPEIEMVSRDRAGTYAEAAKKGAPQAQQVADRFHLLLNRREELRKFLVRKQKWLPEVEEDRSDALPKKAGGKVKEASAPDASQEMEHEQHFRHMSPILRKRGSPPTMDAETSSQVSRANRYARDEAVRALHQQGVSLRDIARRFGMARKTIRQFIRAESFPERSRPASPGGLLDPYKPYLLKRWQQGCCNGAQLYEEIKTGGSTGSASLLRGFLADLRKQHQAAASLALDNSHPTATIPAELPPQPQCTRRMSATRASWLCVSKPAKLDEKQRRHVDQLREGHTDLDTAYQLSQALISMLAERRDKDLDAWLIQATHRGLAELKSFAQGIRRDYAAVHAAFSSPHSNGQVEGQVKRLKLIKRQMFGRAKFDLLRQRVLHAV
jgi:transposase